MWTLPENRNSIRYLIRKRLEKAKELLSSNDMKIVDIACELRFASSSKFSEAFKKELGYLPSHFRKENKQSPSIH